MSESIFPVAQAEDQDAPLDFGDYCLIEQKRFGVPNEIYLYKVIGRLRSNNWRPVPVSIDGLVERGEMSEIVLAICCGVDQSKVERFRVQDVKRAQQATEAVKALRAQLAAKDAEIERLKESLRDARADVGDEISSFVQDMTGWEEDANYRQAVPDADLVKRDDIVAFIEKKCPREDEQPERFHGTGGGR